MTLEQQVTQKIHSYTRKGGKDNRSQQAARMLAFAAHAQALGAREMGQVGGRHVVSYWKALRASGSLADSTLYNHWLAIRELWKLTGKSGEPPRPRKQDPQPPEPYQSAFKDKLFGGMGQRPMETKASADPQETTR